MKYIRTQVLTASEAHKLSQMGFQVKYKQVITLDKDAYDIYVKDQNNDRPILHVISLS